MGLSQAFVTGGTNVGAAAFPSQAKKTLHQYSPGGGTSTDGLSMVPVGGLRNGRVGLYPCFGCGGPHPWSQYRDGKHIVVCPNKNNPGVLENATKNIHRMCKNRKKRHAAKNKKKNLGTANLSDFDESGQKRIREQVLQSMARREISDGASVASSITTPTFAPPGGGPTLGGGCGHGNLSSLLMLSFWPQEARSSRPCQSPFKVICHTSS